MASGSRPPTLMVPMTARTLCRSKVGTLRCPKGQGWASFQTKAYLERRKSRSTDLNGCQTWLQENRPVVRRGLAASLCSRKSSKGRKRRNVRGGLGFWTRSAAKVWFEPILTNAAVSTNDRLHVSVSIRATSSNWRASSAGASTIASCRVSIVAVLQSGRALTFSYSGQKAEGLLRAAMM